MFDNLKPEMHNGIEIYFAKGDKIIAYVVQGEQHRLVGWGDTKAIAFEMAKANLQLGGGKFKQTSKGMMMQGNFQGRNYGRKIPHYQNQNQGYYEN